MSEYASSQSKPSSIDDLPREANEGTLFEGYGTTDFDGNFVHAEVGPSLSVEQYYQSQLALLDIVSGISQRRAFVPASGYKQEIAEEYGSQLPSVVKGARKNASELAHVDLPREYRKEPLIEAGFDPQDVDDDIVLVRMELNREFAGKENKSKRRKRRDELKKKLASRAPR